MWRCGLILLLVIEGEVIWRKYIFCMCVNFLQVAIKFVFPWKNTRDSYFVCVRFQWFSKLHSLLYSLGSLSLDKSFSFFWKLKRCSENQQYHFQQWQFSSTFGYYHRLNYCTNLATLVIQSSDTGPVLRQK